MQEFSIKLHSFQDIRDFVALATVQPFDVHVGNSTRSVNGKSFMGMFTLDFSEPLNVHVNCSPNELQQFLHSVSQYLAD